MYSLGMVLMSVVVGFIFGALAMAGVWYLASRYFLKKMIEANGAEACMDFTKNTVDAINQTSPLDIHLKDDDGNLMD